MFYYEISIVNVQSVLFCLLLLKPSDYLVPVTYSRLVNYARLVSVIGPNVGQQSFSWWKLSRLGIVSCDPYYSLTYLYLQNTKEIFHEDFIDTATVTGMEMLKKG